MTSISHYSVPFPVRNNTEIRQTDIRATLCHKVLMLIKSNVFPLLILRTVMSALQIINVMRHISSLPVRSTSGRCRLWSSRQNGRASVGRRTSRPGQCTQTMSPMSKRNAAATATTPRSDPLGCYACAHFATWWSPSGRSARSADGICIRCCYDACFSILISDDSIQLVVWPSVQKRSVFHCERMCLLS